MKIQVTAVTAQSLPGVWTPQTLWSAKAPTIIEVMDADESPARPPGEAQQGMKIGRTELAALRNTRGLMIQGVDASNAVEVTAQLAEAHAAHAEEVARLKGINDQQSVEIARLKPFEARSVEQEQTIADLRSRKALTSRHSENPAHRAGATPTRP
jgi:hypothetical protein